MGADKAFAALQGRPLYVHAVERLRRQSVRCAISGGRDPDRFQAAAAAADLPIVPDTDGDGPLAGVLAGLDWAASLGAGLLVTAPVDTPFLPNDLAARLRPAAPAYAAGPERAHPLLAAWPVAAIRPVLRIWLQRPDAPRSAMAFCDAVGARAVRWQSEAPFRNLNTPADLERAAAVAGGGR